MNIISRKAYNTIMVEGLEGTGKNLVAIVKDVYVFVGSFTYITDFVILEDIGEFIMSDMEEVLMGKPFRKTTKLKYDVAKGFVSFSKIFDTYIFRMPRTIPRFKNFKWSKIPPLLELSQHDLMNGLRHPYEKNKAMYKNCLNLGPEYKVYESMKEWLIHGHVSIHEVTLYLIRKSLEVLRKFYWMILGGRFNQLSHVSSPLIEANNQEVLSRKSHLLEDKQIPSVGVFDEVFLALGWHLEEIHMTWAHLEKKQTRLRTYTKSLEELCKQCVETALQA
ncbi:hypothetical protein Tco_0669210 [Tanacetum coccineum]